MKKLIFWLLLISAAFGQQVNTDIVPASPGLKLGHTNQRWDANIQNLDVTGTCKIKGVPCGNGGGNNKGGCIATASSLSSTCGTVAGTIASITDGVNAADCTVGNGATVSSCIYTGFIWTPTGGNVSNPNINNIKVNGGSVLTAPVNFQNGSGTTAVATGSNVQFNLTSVIQPGSYTCANLTVGADGRLTAAQNGTCTGGGGGANPGGLDKQLQVNNSATFDGIINVVPGSVLASNGTGAYPAFQTKAMVDIRDIPGVDCTGVSDSGPALNTWISSGGWHAGAGQQAGVRLVVTPDCGSSATGIKLSTTWLIKNTQSLFIDCQAGAGAYSPEFSWFGTAGGTMVDAEYNYGLHIENCAFNGQGLAGIAINIDKTGAGGTVNTSQNTISHNFINGGSAPAAFCGICMSLVSGANVEDMTVAENTITCTVSGPAVGQGIRIGASANAKNERLIHNGIHNCNYGIEQDGGGMDAEYNELGNNNVDFQIASWADPNEVIANNLSESELATQKFLVASLAGAGGQPLNFYGNNIPINTVCAIDLKNSVIAASAFNTFYPSSSYTSAGEPWCNSVDGGFMGTMIGSSVSNNGLLVPTLQSIAPLVYNPTSKLHNTYLEGSTATTAGPNLWVSTTPHMLLQHTGASIMERAIFYGSGVTTENVNGLTTAGASTQNALPCLLDSVCAYEGGMEITGVTTPDGLYLNASNLGNGSTTYGFYVSAVDSSGNETLLRGQSPYIGTRGSTPLSGGNFIIIGGLGSPGAASCNIYAVNPSNSIQVNQILTGVSCSSAWTANVTSYPSTWPITTLRSPFNKTLTFLFRGKEIDFQYGTPLKGFSDQGSTPTWSITGAGAGTFPILNSSGGALNGTLGLTTPTNAVVNNLTINGSCSGCGGGGGSGTVQNIATTAPLSGGPITTTGTLTCPTCVVATVNPVQGIAHFAGATQTATSSGIVDTDISGIVGISHGGTNASTAAGALVNLLPAGTRIGDVIYCSAYSASACTTWSLLAGNNTGATGWLQEPTGGGAPSWTVPSGAGTVAVVGAGSLGSAAIVTGGTGNLVQTVSATSTLDASGNLAVAAGGSVGSVDTGTPKFTFSTNTITANQKIAGTLFTGSTGFAITGATTAGHYLRNNGTNFVDSALLVGDIPSLSATYLPIAGGTLLGNLLFQDNSWDLGSPSFRPKNGYFSVSLNAPTINAATGFQIGGAAPNGHFLTGTGTFYADNARLVDDGTTLSYTGSGGIAASSLSITSPFQIYSSLPAGAFSCLANNSGFGVASDGDWYFCNDVNGPYKIITTNSLTFDLVKNGTSTGKTFIIGTGSSLAPTSGTVGSVTANTLIWGSTALTAGTLPTDGQCFGRSGSTYTGFACSGGGGGTTTNAITFNNGGAGAASGTTFDGSAARTISYNTLGAAASTASTTVQGQTCTLGSSCSVESAAAGQVAISAGIGAALTGAPDLTYNSGTNTFATTPNAVFNLSASTQTNGFVVPSNAANTASVAGALVYDNSLAANYHVMTSATDSVVAVIPTASLPVTGDVIDNTKDGNGHIILHDSGKLSANLVTASNAATSANQVAYSSSNTRLLSYATVDNTITHVLHATAGAPTFSAILATDLPAVPLTGIATQAADTLVANATAGSAAPTAVLFPTTGTNGCAGASNALIYNTTTHALGCNTISASGLAFPVTVSGTVTSGAIPFFSGTTTMSTSALLVANAVMIGGGAATAPSTITAGTNNQVLRGATGGAPAFGSLVAADLPAALSSSTSINKVTFTAPATAGTIAFAADNSTATLPNGTVGLIVASGQTAMPTGALGGNACSASATTATATGGATTDTSILTYASDPTGVTGYGGGTAGGISIRAWITTNTINFKLCNETASSITPGALSVNWRIVR